MIKKLRKFSNMTILCITDNHKLKNDITENLTGCKELIFIDSYSSNILDRSFDILLLDYEFSEPLTIMKDIKLSKPQLPKIVILNEQSEQNVVDCINAGAYSLVTSPVNFSDLKLSIVMALNQSKRVDKICLDNGIYYDSYRERFYDEFEAIPFTKFEFQVLKLLLDNNNRITSYDEIKEKVWKEKKMSIFTMRNVINKIRNKTYYGIIKNNSSEGYQIDSIR